MVNIAQKYQHYCEEKETPFDIISSVRSYDNTTLFCPAGMQQFKSKFKDESYIGTQANIQSCIRLNDFEEIGDATHLLSFDMLGLFSFREMSIEQAIEFWYGFLDYIGLKPDYATIHPDRQEWARLHRIPVRVQDDCEWSDGEIGGYCTEFFVKGIEIGNIVNPLGSCIDAGFGLERISNLINGIAPKTAEETLKETALKIIGTGYKPSNAKQGYVLRKILRELFKKKFVWDNDLYIQEVVRQYRLMDKYEKLLTKYPHQTNEWWWEVHGIEI